jgi:hypothetical protein
MSRLGGSGQDLGVGAVGVVNDDLEFQAFEFHGRILAGGGRGAVTRRIRTARLVSFKAIPQHSERRHSARGISLSSRASISVT